ncbi:transposase [Actinoplanes rectilineatus]|uniref:transposase n=1 Tax=Actinoplanes rectilineatus TaxID=113571 RepID=UPI000B2A74DF
MNATITALPRRRRYPSDTTDTEWEEILAPLLPAPASTTPTGGHPEAHPRREIVDAIRYVVDNGCKWRALPSDFPPWKTVYAVLRPLGQERRTRPRPRSAAPSDPRRRRPVPPPGHRHHGLPERQGRRDRQPRYSRV